MHGHDHNNDPEDELRDDNEPSRSQLRREALDVLKLAHALVAMSDEQLTRVPLDEELRDEVARARAVTQQIARKRQTQYLAKQLRKLDAPEFDAIRTALEHDRNQAHREAASLHRVETWRDRLIAEGVPASLEERRVYRTRFAALIERREAAARNLLQSDRRRDKAPSRPGDHFISAAHAGADQGAPGGHPRAAGVLHPSGAREGWPDRDHQ
jgi:ribosome-associated protein